MGAAAAALLLMPRTATAGPVEDEADALTRQGVEHFKRHDYEAARVAFARAFEMSPRVAILFNLGLAEVQSEHAAEALIHFRLYIHCRDADPAKRKILSAKWFDRASAEASQIRVDASEGETLYLNGVSYGVGPFGDTIPVPPGKYLVETRKGGVLMGSGVAIAVKGSVTLMARLQPPKSEPPPPPSSAVVAASTHASDDQTQWSRGKLLTVGSLGGAAVLTGGIAILFAVSSAGDADHAHDLQAALPSASACALSPLPDGCADLKRTLGNKNTHRDLAVGFGVGASALVLTDILLSALWPATTPERAIAKSVTVAPAASGGMVEWHAVF